ncbi:MAG: hypothetical protein GY702_24680 [Desulfobulbaceae bacterium]|nr:hypothetical protein [Desulfobulbaceae bacterium]
MARKYNFIYGELIKGDDDLVGHVAYSIYKSKKVAFIQDFLDKKGTEAVENDLDLFHQTSLQHLDSYRLEAQKILHTYTQTTLSEYASSIEKQSADKVAAARKGYTDKLKTTIERFKPSFLSGVFQSLIGSIAFTFFLGFLLIVAFGAIHGTDGLLNLFKEIFFNATGSPQPPL